MVTGQYRSGHNTERHFAMYTHNTHVPVSHFRAWRDRNNFGHFTPTAEIQMLAAVPRWRPGGKGYDFWQKVLGPLVGFGTEKTTTIAAVVAAGKEIGLNPGECKRALRWLYTWGDQVLVGGQRYVATVAAPTAPANTSVPAEIPAAAPKAKAKKQKVA